MKWQNKKLVNIAEVRVSNVDKKLHPNKQLVKLCNYMDAYSNDYITSKIDFTTGSADNNQLARFGLKKGDVIITKDSETPEDIAVSSVVDEDIGKLVCGYHLAVLRPDEKEVDGTFLMHKLNLPEVKNYFFRVANGSTRFGLTIGDIENAPIKLPQVEFQKEIARIIRKVDNVIEKTEQAISKYKFIKQGMLYDLFTRGIGADGKLRPTVQQNPDLYKPSALGMIPKEWDEVTVDDVASINGRVGWKGYTVNDLRDSGPLALGASHIDKENRLDLSNPVHLSYEKYLQSPEIMVFKNDILVVQRGTIGKVVNIEEEIGEATINPSMVLLNNIQIDSYFLYWQLASFIGQRQIENLTSQTGVPMITQKQIGEIKIVKPKDNSEILKVSKALKSVQNKILAEDQYFQKILKLKQGLMADLLTGKKEVTINEELMSEKEMMV